jgi:hypothetical protein
MDEYLTAQQGRKLIDITCQGGLIPIAALITKSLGTNLLVLLESVLGLRLLGNDFLITN